MKNAYKTLRDARLELGITLTQVSDLCGITRGKISNFEKGKFKLTHDEESILIDVYKNQGFNFGDESADIKDELSEIENRFGEELAEILTDIFDAVRTPKRAQEKNDESVSGCTLMLSELMEYFESDIDKEKDYSFFGQCKIARLNLVCQCVSKRVIAEMLTANPTLKDRALESAEDNDLALLLDAFDDLDNNFFIADK